MSPTAVTRKPVNKTNTIKELTKMSKKTFNVLKTGEPITFTIDEDEFEAVAAERLPAGTLAVYFQKINEGNLFAAHDAFFKAVLTESSYKLFSDRLNSNENPITVAVLGEVASWLLGEEYMGGSATEESK